MSRNSDCLIDMLYIVNWCLLQHIWVACRYGETTRAAIFPAFTAFLLLSFLFNYLPNESKWCY
ncbi:hypothetical protein V8C34DRAFT_297407 [Trichoderma compactum]